MEIRNGFAARRCWAIAQVSLHSNTCRILGEGACAKRDPVEEQPLLPLLFEKKPQAQAWCRDRNLEYRKSDDPIVRKWRVMAVRVHVLVTPLG